MDYRNNDIDRMNMLSPLVWAYIGDAYYEMFIRTYLVNNSSAKPHKLHIEAIKYVKADDMNLIYSFAVESSASTASITLLTFISL